MSLINMSRSFSQFDNDNSDFPHFPNILPQGAKYAEALTDSDINYIESEFEKYVQACADQANSKYRNKNSFFVLGFGCVSGKNTTVSIQKCAEKPLFEVFQSKKIKNYFSVPYKITYSNDSCEGEEYISLCASNIIRLPDQSIVWCGFEIRENTNTDNL